MSANTPKIIARTLAAAMMLAFSSQSFAQRGPTGNCCNGGGGNTNTNTRNEGSGPKKKVASCRYSAYKTGKTYTGFVYINKGPKKPITFTFQSIAGKAPSSLGAEFHEITDLNKCFKSSKEDGTDTLTKKGGIGINVF